MLIYGKCATTIKVIYKALLPKGESVNSTSLCVYIGPDLDRVQDCWTAEPSPQPILGPCDVSCRLHLPPLHCLVSILYAGDANFKVRSNRLELLEFLIRERWHRIAILQVPHHGSRNNWETGSAADFPQRYSVFCGDEARRSPGHPHREVVLDLLHRGPLLANRSSGWSLRGGGAFASENRNPPAVHHPVAHYLSH